VHADGNEIVLKLIKHSAMNKDPSSVPSSEDKLSEAADSLLKHYDINNDGYVDFHEFVSIPIT